VRAGVDGEGDGGGLADGVAQQINGEPGRGWLVVVLPEGPDNLIEQLGHRFAHGVELLQARMPNPDELRLLELSPGVPVVRMLHIDYDPDGKALQVADDLYAADRHEFAFEWFEPDGDLTLWLNGPTTGMS
jgi:GntR family transcriptional regulator